MADKLKILEPTELVPPDPVTEVRADAASLPNDGDDKSDAGKVTTTHEDRAWRSIRIVKP